MNLRELCNSAEIVFRLGTQYPEESAVMRYRTTDADHLTIETESGMFIYRMGASDTLRARVLNAYPPHCVEPIPNTWGSTPLHTQHAIAALAHAARYMAENPKQALMLSVSPVSITLMTTGTPCGYAVTIIPATAAQHLQASEDANKNAFSYLQHAI